MSGIIRHMSIALLWAAAIGSIATAVFTGLLWFVAKAALEGTKQQLTLLVKQAERDGRPYIAADVVPGLHGPGAWDLVVTNNGKSAARNVRYSFDDWDAKGDDDRITDRLKRYLRMPHLMVPGARHRVMWRTVHIRNSETIAAGMDASAGITITYDDDRGKSFSDHYDFDVEALSAASPAPAEGSAKIGTGRELANIDLAIRNLSMHLGELRR